MYSKESGDKRKRTLNIFDSLKSDSEFRSELVRKIFTTIDEVQRANKDKLSYLSGTILLREIYYTVLGFLNPEDDDIFFGVRHREEEDFSRDGTFYNLSKIFLDFEINQTFGISLSEWMNMERYKRENLIELSTLNMEKQSAELKNLRENINQTKKLNEGLEYGY